MVRIAKLEDSLEATKYLVSFYKNSEIKFNTSAAWGMALFKSCVLEEDRIAIIKDGGILLGVVSQSLLGPFKQAHEIVWWVEPDKRGIDSIKMLKIYENWALQKGASMIELKSLSAFPETEKIYQKMGYQLLEKSWIKKVD